VAENPLKILVISGMFHEATDTADERHRYCPAAMRPPCQSRWESRLTVDDGRGENTPDEKTISLPAISVSHLGHLDPWSWKLPLGLQKRNPVAPRCPGPK